MSLKFAVAPCSWGIENPTETDNPPWYKMLDDAGKSGFSGIELGPYGYLPTDPSVLKDKLASKQLELIAGTIYDDLTAAADIEQLCNKTRKICGLLSKVMNEKQKGNLVIIDAVKELRNNTAGNSKLAQRLNADDWKLMMENIRVISKISEGEFGVRPVIHPHAGGYIEFKDETEQFLNDIDEKTTGLCLDTGHLFYAGDDPASSLKECSSRLDYVHFKDIDPEIHKKALNGRLGFFDACKLGVMCSIGRGCVDYNSVFRVLYDIDYMGWITIEQERDPKDSSGTLADIKMSHDYLIKTVAGSE